MTHPGRPQDNEFDEFYAGYIALVTGDDPLARMEAQVGEVTALGARISEEQSTAHYAPGKWNLRQLLNHVSDTERVDAFRALWFGRGFETPLPAYDQDVAAATAGADAITWAEQVEEFRRVRLATLSMCKHFPADAWNRVGIASGKPISVRALVWLIAGHAAHHLRIVRERYLNT